jgi:hypothetical protein
LPTGAVRTPSLDAPRDCHLGRLGSLSRVSTHTQVVFLLLVNLAMGRTQDKIAEQMDE